MHKQRMFSWRSSGGSEPLDGLGNMSKTDILRGIITEKLSTAAREILAVVERTVADYEEEASGFRRQIEGQRRQLEVLQPHVKLNRVLGVPELPCHEVVVVSEEHEEEITPQKVGEDSGNLDFFWYNDVEDADEEPLPVQPQMGSREKREDLKDPDYHIFSRVRSHRKPGRPRGSGTPRGPGRPRLSDAPAALEVRVWLLQDCETEVLCTNVYKSSPVQDLRCSRGLQESDFLQLLKSLFPQLAGGEPFDVLIADNMRRLHPLAVRTLAAEEVYRSIRATRKTALFLRLKTGRAPRSGGEDLAPPQEQDEVRSDPASPTATSAAQAEANSGSVKRRRGRPRLGDEPTHHALRMCMLEDSLPGMPTETVFQRSSVQDLVCPRSLQEADFVELLRSTFPQLAGEDKRFNIYKSDRSRKLQRIRVESLTPEEIHRSLRSMGIAKTLLYIKLKTQEDDEGEELDLLPDKDESLSTDTVMMEGEAGLLSSPGRRVDGPRRGSAPRHIVGLNPEEDAADSDVERCHDDGDDDWKPDPEEEKPKRAQKWGPQSGVAKNKIPCRVCSVSYRLQGGLIRHAWSHVEEAHAVCGVCGQSFASSQELSKHLRSYQKTHDCSYCGKSFFTVTGLNSHTTVHTGNRPYRCHVCSKTFVSASALGVHRWVHEADRPYRCDLCSKTFGLMAQLRAHRKAHLSRDKFQCHVCGRCLYDLRSLSRHKMTHSLERRFGCQVCGKRFKLPGSLKSHEKTHTERERPFLCHVCCKTFLTNSTLMAHMKTHSGERPFVCVVCGKGFLFNGELKNHSRTHTGEAPYGCSQCGRFFKLRSTLNSHIRSHLGIKRYVCSVCGKACSRQEHLTVHMRTHNGERPYKCTLCDKAFTQGHCLKTHMKSHQADGSAVPEPSAEPPLPALSPGRPRSASVAFRSSHPSVTDVPAAPSLGDDKQDVIGEKFE